MANLLARLEGARGAERSLDEKIDAGLGDTNQTYPVFIRMADQLFKGSGDYERFCRENVGARRTGLRQEILQILHTKADASWSQVVEFITPLESSGSLQNIERFWIVNGFACDATGAACRRLAALDAVSFVYIQRGPLRQQKRHQTPVESRSAPNHRNVFRRVLAEWQDDSDVPFTTKGLRIPWNLRAIQADAAWNQEGVTGRGVVVALLDSGLMVVPALTSALWKNIGEEFNGKDDDGNGYVDDVFGYDFHADSYYCLGDRAHRPPHGSMCGGIIAGRPLNRMNLVTGVAPRARLMVLRGAGYLKAYEYALTHGADVLSMSYMWVDEELGNYRGVYRTAHEHLAAAGIVAVGGAGNYSDRPPGRQIALPKDIPCVITTAGLTRARNKAPDGSEGPCTWRGVKFYDDYPPKRPLCKPDVTALYAGFPVWGRLNAQRGKSIVYSREDNQKALVVGPRGNSLAGPHAAGVAALMLSANPDLCAWVVKDLMERTCLDLSLRGRDYTYGAGLLQARKAVQAARRVANK